VGQTPTPAPAAQTRLAQSGLSAPLWRSRGHVKEVLRRDRWNVCHAQTIREASLVLRERRVAVIICESDLPDGNWKTLLDQSRLLDNVPRLIVTGRLADEELWTEVLHHGGYDVLAKPYRNDEMLWVVRSAWTAWQASREMECAPEAAAMEG
jgi:DNA-binding response OmpR family regulator